MKEAMPIALQLYSVREDMAADFEGTLKKVAAMGYDGVEFAGLFDKKPEDIKRMLKALGLTPISAHVAFTEMLGDPDKVLADYAAIGCRYVVIPYLTEEYRPGTPGFAETIKGACTLGEAAKRNGMQLLYHNHDFEFARVEGEYALDVLYSSVSADLLQTELDTCWINVAGVDPVSYIRKYAGRSPVVHLKDFVMPGKKPAHMYELIGIQDDPQKGQEAEVFEFRPLGCGVQDFPAILAAAEESGTGWVIVEQDQPSMGKTPLECAETSLRYLKKLK